MSDAEQMPQPERTADQVIQDLQAKFGGQQRQRKTETPSSDTSSGDDRHERLCECGRGAAKGYSWGGREVHWARCELCQAEARVEAEAAEQRERDAKREAMARQRIEGLPDSLSRMGVTRKYQHVTLAEFDRNPDWKALDAATDFVDEFRAGKRPSLYLFSQRPGESIAPGSGKTHLAVATLREIASDMSVRLEDLGFAFVPRMLLEIQSTFKHPERSELSVVKKYVRPELLVWDDFGAEKLSDYAARTLYTILYEREGRSNIFTSNLSLGDIEARDPSGYTQRITSRIAGDATIVRLVGPDRRLARPAA